MGLSVPFHDTLAPEDSRDTVVLVHGTGGSAKTHFRTLFPMLAARYRVLAVDLQSPDGELTLGGLSEQVAAARYAVIDSGHAVPQERPAQLFQLINEFVTDPAAAPAGGIREALFV